MTPTELLSLTARDLSQRIAAREISCRDLMHSSLRCIGQLNPRFNALVSLRPAGALR